MHEIKFDGYRMHAQIDGREVKLLTRTGLDWSHRYLRTIEALKLPEGEIGATSTVSFARSMATAFRYSAASRQPWTKATLTNSSSSPSTCCS